MQAAKETGHHARSDACTGSDHKRSMYLSNIHANGFYMSETNTEEQLRIILPLIPEAAIAARSCILRRAAFILQRGVKARDTCVYIYIEMRKDMQ